MEPSDQDDILDRKVGESSQSEPESRLEQIGEPQQVLEPTTRGDEAERRGLGGVPTKGSDLPTPETTAKWKAISEYFQSLDAEGVDTPPHVWVINEHAEEINVVVSTQKIFEVTLGDDTNQGFGSATFVGPAMRKTLGPWPGEVDNSAAVFPLWAADAKHYHLSIIQGQKTGHFLTISPGSWAYFPDDSEEMRIVNPAEMKVPKSFPLFPIRINGNMVDLKAESASHNDMESKYVLVQSWMPLTAAQREKLEEMGLKLQEYVSKNTYLCRRDGTELDLLRQLSFVVYVDIYRQEYKILPGLGSVARRARSHPSFIPREVDIVFHKSAIAEKVQNSIAKVLCRDSDTLESDPHKLRITVEEQQLEELASIDEVRAIVEVDKSEVRCHRAREIIRVDQPQGTNQNPGRYEGQREVVAVADTGFDSGHIQNIHHAFRDAGPGLRTTRVRSIYPMSKIPLVNDFDGHGTHVCGLAVGRGHRRDRALDLKGTAPQAQLVVQCLGPTLDGIPDNLENLFGHLEGNAEAVHA
ncbi:hypothetical protein NM208_g11655 [Fusarium decemcellulare]|uniref:Uncharacterized protein n=1 Tax=Fusarium decemcellulare TaxID=57161 RepID=A0ACC1RSY7_9HYPO|nr:hypothetical protein NM208_g11655 [Fusarium decemcellulare]